MASLLILLGSYFGYTTLVPFTEHSPAYQKPPEPRAAPMAVTSIVTSLLGAVGYLPRKDPSGHRSYFLDGKKTLSNNMRVDVSCLRAIATWYPLRIGYVLPFVSRLPTFVSLLVLRCRRTTFRFLLPTIFTAPRLVKAGGGEALLLGNGEHKIVTAVNARYNLIFHLELRDKMRFVTWFLNLFFGVQQGVRGSPLTHGLNGFVGVYSFSPL